MHGAREYHVKQNKPIPQNQRPNIFSDMQMLIHNKGEGVGKNRGTLDWTEECEGTGGV